MSTLDQYALCGHEPPFPSCKRHDKRKVKTSEARRRSVVLLTSQSSPSIRSARPETVSALDVSPVPAPVDRCHVSLNPTSPKTSFWRRICACLVARLSPSIPKLTKPRCEVLFCDGSRLMSRLCNHDDQCIMSRRAEGWPLPGQSILRRDHLGARHQPHDHDERGEEQGPEKKCGPAPG